MPEERPQHVDASLASPGVLLRFPGLHDAPRSAQQPNPRPGVRPGRQPESTPTRPPVEDASVPFLRLAPSRRPATPGAGTVSSRLADTATSLRFPTQRDAIAHENTKAAQLPMDDARVIFAQRVQTSLEGGKAAILRPERRRALMSFSLELGLRSFDATMVIALVQDAARRGQVLAALQPGVTTSDGSALAHVRDLVLADEAQAALAIIPPALKAGLRNQHDTTIRDRVILVVVLALFMLVSMIMLLGP